MLSLTPWTVPFPSAEFGSFGLVSPGAAGTASDVLTSSSGLAKDAGAGFFPSFAIVPGVRPV